MAVGAPATVCIKNTFIHVGETEVDGNIVRSDSGPPLRAESDPTGKKASDACKLKLAELPIVQDDENYSEWFDCEDELGLAAKHEEDGVAEADVDNDDAGDLLRTLSCVPRTSGKHKGVKLGTVPMQRASHLPAGWVGSESDDEENVSFDLERLTTYDEFARIPSVSAQVSRAAPVAQAADVELQEDDDLDDGALERIMTHDPFAPQTPMIGVFGAESASAAAPFPTFARGQAGVFAPMVLAGYCPPHCAMISLPCPMPDWSIQGGSSVVSSQCPPLGVLHSFHKEVRSFGAVSPDFRQFTKGPDYEGRLSVLSESRVHEGGLHRFLVQLSAGKLTKADGVGFVFSRRLPCTKNIQKITSVFVNRRGQICLRVLGEVVRGLGHVRPLKIGDWVELAINLDDSSAIFNVWPFNPATRPDSSAEVHFKHELGSASDKVDLRVGHLACVVQNVGLMVTLAS